MHLKLLGGGAEFASTQQGDSAEFMGKARAIAIAVARSYRPAHLYVVRIDNWFFPKWMNFAGKLTVGKGAAIDVYKTRLHLPPFVPSRVVGQQVFAGPDYKETVATAALHIECPSKRTLSRRIAEIDKDAAFLWLSVESETQKRGSLMMYLPVEFDATVHRRDGLGDSGTFYVGLPQRERVWEQAMLRGISRSEVAHFEDSGRALFEAHF